MEYFVNNDLLANLEKLCEKDRPHGIKCMSLHFAVLIYSGRIELTNSGSLKSTKQLDSPPTRQIPSPQLGPQATTEIIEILYWR